MLWIQFPLPYINIFHQQFSPSPTSSFLCFLLLLSYSHWIINIGSFSHLTHIHTNTYTLWLYTSPLSYFSAPFFKKFPKGLSVDCFQFSHPPLSWLYSGFWSFLTKSAFAEVSNTSYFLIYHRLTQFNVPSFLKSLFSLSLQNVTLSRFLTHFSLLFGSYPEFWHLNIMSRALTLDHFSFLSV